MWLTLYFCSRPITNMKTRQLFLLEGHMRTLSQQMTWSSEDCGKVFSYQSYKLEKYQLIDCVAEANDATTPLTPFIFGLE